MVKSVSVRVFFSWSSPSVRVRVFFWKVKSVCPSYGPTEFRGSGNFWAKIRASEKRKPRSPWFFKKLLEGRENECNAMCELRKVIIKVCERNSRQF